MNRRLENRTKNRPKNEIAKRKPKQDAQPNSIHPLAASILGGLIASVFGFPEPRAHFTPPQANIPMWFCKECNIDLGIMRGATKADVPYCPKCRRPMILKTQAASVVYGPPAIDTTCEDVTHPRLPEPKQ